MDHGHSKVSRKAFLPVEDGGDPFWNEHRVFSRWEAWEYLFSVAARYADQTWVVRGGKVVELRRGETHPLSIRFLEKAWNWDKGKVHRFMSTLIEMRRVTRQQRTADGDTYLIIKYEDYPAVRDNHETGNETANETVAGKHPEKHPVRQPIRGETRQQTRQPEASKRDSYLIEKYGGYDTARDSYETESETANETARKHPNETKEKQVKDLTTRLKEKNTKVFSKKDSDAEQSNFDGMIDPGEPLSRKVSSRGKDRGEQIREVFEFWKDESGHTRATLTADRKRKIQARLNVYSVDDLKQAIRGACSNPFYQGDNEQGQRYDWIETILKNDAVVQRHMAYEPPAISGKGSHPEVTLSEEWFR